ncbi:transposase [Patescibacteria group bacterium]
MARPLRVEYPGALYHVISRGNGYQNIFKDDKDHWGFLDWLKDAVELHNVIIHAYCLMHNHYHLLVETPDANLSKAMRDINGNYTQWFNTRHKTVGHLFQGRYKAFVIEKDVYLLQVARYIVLNPVRAKITEHPRQYKWSSYKFTGEIKKSPEWLHPDWILQFFNKDKKEAQKQYRKFIKSRLDAEDPHTDVRNGFLLGSPQFVHWIWETQTNGSEELKEHPREQRIVGRLTLEELFDGVKTKEERNMFIKIARFRCGYLTTEIAQHLGLHRAVVGKISRET